MKKSLLAVAAIGAFASAAQAQSSVTVYGILDVGFQGVTTRGTAASSTSTAVQNPVAGGKSNQTRFSGEGSEQTSRLGFRGTEDLGGGMSAFFTAEFQLSPTDATLSGTYGNGLANRQTFVGLKKNGIGQAAIGTQYTPIHMAVGRTDPGQQNNMLGNVIYATNASQGSGQTATSYTVRYNNALTLMTDRIAGFQVNAIYNNNNTDTNQTAAAGGSTNNNAWGAGVNYVWNKLNVDAAIQNSSSSNWTAQQTTGPALPASASTAAANLPANPLGTAINMAQQYYGATYDFGILKAYAGYISAKYSNQATPSSYLQRTAQQIGVRSFVTPTIEAWASAGTGRFEGQNLAQSAAALAVKSSASQNFTGYQLGSNYWLSKRTNMYAIFGSTQVSSSGVAMSEGGSSYGVGVRHTF
ncbi:porin [Polynucleobacter asymbioticus]|uniref:porin n=1 Tax=Polynucleobacter asymbioticus TaxID=576611 RepID=UPI001BFD5274|nr:porin [Polynucleobacter asymbioticus]QWD85429.1 porin [Polynucleobacter asymbioticus]